MFDCGVNNVLCSPDGGLHLEDNERDILCIKKNVCFLLTFQLASLIIKTKTNGKVKWLIVDVLIRS